jgi:hypothetical protein
VARVVERETRNAFRISLAKPLGETFTWKIEKKMEYDIKMDEGDGLLAYCAM